MRLSVHHREQERWRRRISKSPEVQAIRGGMIPVSCTGQFHDTKCPICSLSIFNDKLHKTMSHGWVHAECSKGQFVLMSGGGWHISQLQASNTANINEKEYDESMVRVIPSDLSVEKPAKWRSKRKRRIKGKTK